MVDWDMPISPLSLRVEDLGLCSIASSTLCTISGEVLGLPERVSSITDPVLRNLFLKILIFALGGEGL